MHLGTRCSETGPPVPNLQRVTGRQSQEAARNTSASCIRKTSLETVEPMRNTQKVQIPIQDLGPENHSRYGPKAMIP